jgi:hypothetical protein
LFLLLGLGLLGQLFLDGGDGSLRSEQWHYRHRRLSVG